jgi:hypothetical protein
MDTKLRETGKDPFFFGSPQRVPEFGTPEYMKIRFGGEEPTPQERYEWCLIARMNGY